MALLNLPRPTREAIRRNIYISEVEVFDRLLGNGIRLREASMSTSVSCIRASRRELTATAATAALAAASCAPTQTGGTPATSPSQPQNLVGDGRKSPPPAPRRRVLTLDPKVGDFENADVLIDGSRIAEVRPGISASDAEVVDCAGTILMPGFITTHHHQYEVLQRRIIADGFLLLPQAQCQSMEEIRGRDRRAFPGRQIVWPPSTPAARRRIRAGGRRAR
jgi:hypothetical protein